MASIKNSIVLQDRMTPVLRSTIRAMNTALMSMRSLDRQATKGVQSKAYINAAKNILRSNRELRRMQKELDKVENSAIDVGNAMGEVEKQTSRASQAGNSDKWGFSAQNLASSLYVLQNIRDTLTDIMETPDRLATMGYRLEVYDNSDATQKQLMDSAYAAAQRSKSEWESTADLASRILISGATNGSGAQAVKMAEILNKASFLGGSSSEESQRALLQLSQALSSGTLQGDELRAIREQAPGLTDTLSKGLSKLAQKGLLPEKFLDTSIGDLKDLGGEGELTAQRVIAAFNVMADEVDAAFENSPKTFGQAMTGVGNVWKRWLNVMNQGDNALAKINQAGWDLLEWLQSDKGTRFFNGLSKVVNFVVDVVFAAVDVVQYLVGQFFAWEDSTTLLKAALIALGAVIAYNAISSVISFIASSWMMLLIIGAVIAALYFLIDAGVSFSDIFGWIGGAVLAVLYAVYDVLIWLWVAIKYIWDISLKLTRFLLNIIQIIAGVLYTVISFIIQIILYVVSVVWTVGRAIWHAIQTVVALIETIIETAVLGVYGSFVWLANGTLKVLSWIASAIDWVFGTNMADTINGWMDGLSQSYTDMETQFNVKENVTRVGDIWSDFGSDTADLFVENTMLDTWWDNLGKLDDGMSTAKNFLRGMEMTDQEKFDLVQNTKDKTLNPLEGWEKGQAWGQQVGEKLDNLDIGSKIGDIEDLLAGYTDDPTTSLNGGSIDQVDKIGSDVDISDEDIKLIRDMIARDFLINLQSVTPTANINFGDIHETADVNKIMEVIQDMVDEELATSLVID